MKKFLLVLNLATCFILLPTISANAAANLDIDTDCEGYTISGAFPNFCGYWHSGDCLSYFIEGTHYGGTLVVEDSIDLIYETPNTYECITLTVEDSVSWGEEICGNVSVVTTMDVLHQCGSWIHQSEAITKEFFCPCGDGCSPGYWKNHLDSWGPTGLSPSDDFDTTFGVDYFDPDITLDEAVNLRGGRVNKVARHGTSALLNALHPDVNYFPSGEEVIAAVRVGDVGTLVDFNEISETCPAEYIPDDECNCP